MSSMNFTDKCGLWSSLVNDVY